MKNQVQTNSKTRGQQGIRCRVKPSTGSMGPVFCLCLLFTVLRPAFATGASSVSYSFSHEQFDLPNESLTLGTHRLSAGQTISEDWKIALQTGFVQVDSDSLPSLSSLTDTKIALTRHVGTNVLLQATALIPTGTSELTSVEFPVASLIQDALLQASTPSLGSGFGFVGGASYTYSPAPMWTVGIGSVLGYRSSIHPIEGGPEVERGSRLSATGAADYNSGLWNWRGQVQWRHRGDNTIGAEKIATLSGWGIESTLLRRGVSASTFVRAGFSVPNEYELETESDELVYSAVRGPRTRIALGSRLHIHAKVDLEGIAEATLYAGARTQTEDHGSASRWSLQIGSDFKPNRQHTIGVTFKTFSGSLSSETDPLGPADDSVQGILFSVDISRTF